MLRPIQSLEEALPVLRRGFPAIPPSAWSAAGQRLDRHRGAQGPAGYLLQAGGRDVGVILTIPSERREADGAARRVVNLSSWYVDAAHRWRAPRMLQQVVGGDALYTDLTPTPSVQAMNGRLGFDTWTEGALVFVLPVSAGAPARAAHVVPLHGLPPDSLPAPVRAVMEEHAGWDCIAGALWDGAALHPLIFSRTARKGVPIARLIYAQSRARVAAHSAAIARFLLRERIALMVMNANRHDRTPGSIFTRRLPPTFFKGRMSGAETDHTYSEFVFLQF